MIQFNLLPDVKMEYIQAERVRRLVISISIIVTAVSVAILLLLFSASLLQHKHLNDLSDDIKTDSAKLQGQTDLNKILTVQNQLQSLSALHDGKPAASRLTGYMNEVTPSKANINNLLVDFAANTVSVTGTADALSTVNQYVDTLKFTTYKVGNDATATPAFSAVVLSAFGITEHQATYTITFSYDPTIFDITKTVALTVPKQVTTRSTVEQPTDLFALPIDNPSSGKVKQ